MGSPVSVDARVYEASVKKVTRALETHKNRLAGRFDKGLMSAGRVLLGESKKLVPVDLGNLRDTSHVRQEGMGFQVIVYVAYTEDYAVYVHEDLNKLHGRAFNAFYSAQIASGITHARRPQEQAKFLEKPVRDPVVQKKMIYAIDTSMRATGTGVVEAIVAA